MRRRPPTKRQLCAPAPSDFVVRLRAMVIVRTMAHGDGSRAAAFLSVLSVFLAAMFLRTGAWRHRPRRKITNRTDKTPTPGRSMRCGVGVRVGPRGLGSTPAKKTDNTDTTPQIGGDTAFRVADKTDRTGFCQFCQFFLGIVLQGPELIEVRVGHAFSNSLAFLGNCAPPPPRIL